MRTIDLTRNQVALVDDGDYDHLAQYSWAAILQRTGNYYAIRSETCPCCKAHRHIRMHHELVKPLPGYEHDHIDGNGLNNQRANLRMVTRRQNNQNARRKAYNATSRYKGVHWVTEKGRWRAFIRVNGQLKHLGYFINEIEAAKAYDSAAVLHFGGYAATNDVLTVRA